MKIEKIRAQRDPHPLEHFALERCLAGAENAAVTAIEIPMLTQLRTETETIFSDRGFSYITFRVRDNEKDLERFSGELLRFLHRVDWAVPLNTGDGENPLETQLNLLLAWKLERDCFVILDDAALLACPDGLAGLLEQMIVRCNERFHFVLLASGSIPFLNQIDMLPRNTVRLTPESFVLDPRSADECLQSVYPDLPESGRNWILSQCGGWVSAMDVAGEQLVKDGGEAPHRPYWEIARYLPAVNELLERWTAASWTEEELACMEKLCVAKELKEPLALRLTDGRTEPLKRLAGSKFLICCRDVFSPAYAINGVLQSWLYYRTESRRGRGFLMEQHRIAAQYGKEIADWQMVFFHQLRRGYVEDAALTLRYLSFSEMDASILEEYRRLVHKLPPASLCHLPWVQLGYAISVKYSYPNIAFQYLDQAIEIFRASGDQEGIVLGCCQKISMGFFAAEQRVTTEEILRILAEENFAEGKLEPLLDGYRKVFTAYALIQRAADYSRAIDLLDQAERTAIVRENDNLRLWACFVRILTYKDCQYNDGLRSILDESMRIVEAPDVQKPLKMCLYQTVAFLYYVETGQYREACTCCERAARIAEEIEAFGYSIYINMVHAYALDCLGRFEQAERVILNTEKISCSILNIRNEYLWAYYLIGRSYHYFLKGDSGLALDTAEKALSYARRSGRISYIIRGLLVLGNILEDGGNYDRAESLAVECLSLCHGRKYQFYQISALFLRAQIFRRRGQRAAFEGCFAQLAEESKAAGIFHFNFANPATICEVLRDYHAPEKDKTFFAQLEACNTIGEAQEKIPVLDIIPKKEVEVRILGPLTVMVKGRVLEPCASAKAVQLLRMLALNTKAVSIYKVMEAIWPDWEKKSAMNNFYFTLHQLRCYLGGKGLVIYKRGLCSLNDEFVSVDSTLFDQLTYSARRCLSAGNPYAAERYFEQAIGLCYGSVLDGDDLPDDAILQREALERNIFTAQRDFGIALIERNALDRAEQILSGAINNAFADERTYRLLMRAQYLSGDKSSALTTYERLCVQLRTDLGVEPHHLTKTLVDRIRHNQELALSAD